MSLQEAIDSLPQTSAEIAALLVSKRIKGPRRDSNCCPLARYLSILVRSHIAVGLYEAHNERPKCFVPLPPAASRFIQDFDDGGLYQNLREVSPS